MWYFLSILFHSSSYWVRNSARVFIVPVLLIHMLLQIIPKHFYGIWGQVILKCPSVPSKKSLTDLSLCTSFWYVGVAVLCLAWKERANGHLTSDRPKADHLISVFIQVCNLLTLHILSGELTNIFLTTLLTIVKAKCQTLACDEHWSCSAPLEYNKCFIKYQYELLVKSKSVLRSDAWFFLYNYLPILSIHNCVVNTWKT